MTAKTKKIITYAAIFVGAYVIYKKFISKSPGLLGLGKTDPYIKAQKVAAKQASKIQKAIGKFMSQADKKEIEKQKWLHKAEQKLGKRIEKIQKAQTPIPLDAILTNTGGVSAYEVF